MDRTAASRAVDTAKSTAVYRSPRLHDGTPARWGEVGARRGQGRAQGASGRQQRALDAMSAQGAEQRDAHARPLTVDTTV